jgi:LysM repeat protein
MNNPNPFVPKGSLLEQQSQRRSRLKIAVFCVLAVSVTGLVAMLIQGCKRETPNTDQTLAVDTNPPAMDMSSNPPVVDTNLPPTPPVAPSNTVVAPPTQPTPPPVVPTEIAAAGTYEVVGGDTLAKIAKKNGVSLKALENANPGVDPKKLKIKQKLNIPASTKGAEAVGAAPAGAPEAAATGGEGYTVKSGDTLAKIAKKNGVSLKALRAANPKVATTDHIRVGDKLVIPSKTESAAPAVENTAAPVTPPPASMPAPAPAPVTPAPSPAPGH